MRVAIINDNTHIVDNIILAGSMYDLAVPANHSAVDIDNIVAGIGYTYDGANFIAPTVAPSNKPILLQLAMLDSYIPRGLEDMWVATGFDTTTLPSQQQARLAQKQSLRSQLH